MMNVILEWVNQFQCGNEVIEVDPQIGTHLRQPRET
jgi:hypothetical protein